MHLIDILTNKEKGSKFSSFFFSSLALYSNSLFHTFSIYEKEERERGFFFFHSFYLYLVIMFFKLFFVSLIIFPILYTIFIQINCFSFANFTLNSENLQLKRRILFVIYVTI
jgi:hypothetical protein